MTRYWWQRGDVITSPDGRAVYTGDTTPTRRPEEVPVIANPPPSSVPPIASLPGGTGGRMTHTRVNRTLPPYHPAGQKCRKCGLDEAQRTRYVAPGEISGHASVGECLERECARCGYTWPEAVITPAGEPSPA
jgi:hypothetical protein